MVWYGMGTEPVVASATLLLLYADPFLSLLAEPLASWDYAAAKLDWTHVYISKYLSTRKRGHQPGKGA